jgi:hypothetical protein
MSDETRKVCLGSQVEQVREFLETYGCYLADHADITGEILGVMNNRGEDWPWVQSWIAEEGSTWLNDLQTLVFEVPLTNLTGRASLGFTQEVWMLQPSVFEYQTWGGRTFVRMWWDRNRGAFPGALIL